MSIDYIYVLILCINCSFTIFSIAHLRTVRKIWLLGLFIWTLPLHTPKTFRNYPWSDWEWLWFRTHKHGKSYILLLVILHCCYRRFVNSVLSKITCKVLLQLDNIYVTKFLMHIFIYQTKKNILYLKHIMLAEYLSILSKYFDRSYSGKIIIQRNIIISSIDLKHSCNLYLFSYFIILYFIYLLVFCM